MANYSSRSCSSTGVVCAPPAPRARPPPLCHRGLRSHCSSSAVVPYHGRTDGRTDRQIDRKSYAIRTSDLRGDGSESGPARLRGQSLPSRSATGRAPSAFGFGCCLPSLPRPCVPTECPTPRSEVRSAASDRRRTRRGRPRDGRGKRERGGEKFLLVCVAAVL